MNQTQILATKTLPLSRQGNFSPHQKPHPTPLLATSFHFRFSKFSISAPSSSPPSLLFFMALKPYAGFDSVAPITQSVQDSWQIGRQQMGAKRCINIVCLTIVARLPKGHATSGLHLDAALFPRKRKRRKPINRALTPLLYVNILELPVKRYRATDGKKQREFFCVVLDSYTNEESRHSLHLQRRNTWRRGRITPDELTIDIINTVRAPDVVCLPGVDELSGLPSMPGGIGASFIAIQIPTGVLDNPKLWYCRKGFYDVILQGINNANGLFIYIDVSCQDRGWKKCALRWNPMLNSTTNPMQLLQSCYSIITKPSYLPGDKVYPNSKWLVPPNKLSD
ncbi:hypothetical protein BDK51DRAFT_27914 [Blyttiomyces helicus]|uniref:Uncharacterized protein n=1 Tax=Blyttiomyces helicus TaxID=388810 RepID=A0A4P9WQ45_9FUNG|nr:hypothetical protein BDK51DRAFT_27914 [Blyttiomyces helicus]|eukprot:RKO93908.1 hypothetical protein BDK51DRAFT_27914 [Blyttiomyces helicus]